MPMEHCDFLCISDFLKARPAEEAGERYVYLEASNEARDQQGEVVLAKALADSAQYFLQYGNFDIDHFTLIGARKGIPDYTLYEIGRPVDVRVVDNRTLVKGLIYRGEGPAAEKANQFWDSITMVRPPQRWYPSVGGAVLDRDPVNPSIVRQVRWNNIGFSKTPVNQTVPTVSTVPFGALAKSWTTAGFDLRKALESGYGTDVATLQGGGALREQSLDHTIASYWDFRETISSDISKREVKEPTAERLVAFAAERYGLSKDQAAEWVERFMHDLRENMKRRSTQ